ncbi:putative phenylalanine aminotransferase [Kitasatospora phosalacinea]|uniref:Aromatic amino acid aminotransferase n=1 Tax=Kitasatospora phosalacinea TaxID=2065 RepID=A0A9W6QE78_9ACTN|nr:histidinol-phosphate transaminase [Kitasatospora phosalacinea]GLW73253.1 putative phenylalanine aminotransferase [Kitasatospora phosalacinea]
MADDATAPSTPRIRSAVARLAGYRPGPPVRSPEGRAYPLAANESPYGPPPAVLAAIAAGTADAHRYPDPGCGALTAELAEHLGVPADAVAVGCGSVGVTRTLLETVAEPGTEVLYAWRSFEAYPLLTALSGATPVEVPLRDGRHDLAAMAAAITPRTRMVLVCNPNNPTGTVVRGAELEEFLDRVPADCLVVLDEAYREYVRDPGTPDGLDLLAGRPNVLVLRTFSKAYGLAGLRVGYAVGRPELVAQVRKAAVPFGVSGVAQAAAVAALRSGPQLLARVERTVRERERVGAALLGLGLPVLRSEANFLWLPLGAATDAFHARCSAAGVAVRSFPGEGTRVSIGSPEENDAFLTAAAAASAEVTGAVGAAADAAARR